MGLCRFQRMKASFTTVGFPTITPDQDIGELVVYHAHWV